VILRWLLLGLLLLAHLPAGAETLTVGSKRFTESYILGEILRLQAESAQEAQVRHRPGLGNTGILYAALRSGSIDLYPEYTGTIDQELLKNPRPSDLTTLQRQLAPLGLGVAIPFGFNNTYALALRADQAERLKIRSLSDLARHPELKLALSPEFLNRRDGWPGLRQVYGFTSTPQSIDHGLAYEALAGGQIDLTDVYTTDAKIARYGLRVLLDDRAYFPAYQAVILYRRDLPQRLPKTWAALEQLTGQIGRAHV